MVFPDERVAEVCRLGPLKAARLLEKARAGDLRALADFTVRAVYRKILLLGATPAQALVHTRTLIGRVELTPKVSI